MLTDNGIININELTNQIVYINAIPYRLFKGTYKTKDGIKEYIKKKKIINISNGVVHLGKPFGSKMKKPTKSELYLKL